MNTNQIDGSSTQQPEVSNVPTGRHKMALNKINCKQLQVLLVELASKTKTEK